MKHYIYSMLSFAALLLLVGACKKEVESDEDILNSRILASAPLEVSFASDGSEVTSLSFSHSATRHVMEVKVNNDNLRWNLESNRDWCKVIPEEHRGSGKVTLQIDANESFDDRDPATLTFVAGEYRKTNINVNQSATAFIVGQPYFIVPMKDKKDATETQLQMTTKVTTPAGKEWECNGNDWLTVTKGATSTIGDFPVTDLTITASVNSGASRYGSVTLVSGQEKEEIFVWQFGTDLDYNEDGNIFFKSGSPAQIVLKAPAYSIEEVVSPDFGKAEVSENEDGTSTITITLEDNLSDCGDVRIADFSVKMTNLSASVVAIPTLVQDYVPAHGLVTAKGLKKFAEAIASGASTADWEKDGVVNIVQDISMADETEWVGIGTKNKPFTGKFDGAGHAVTYLTGTGSGLFNYTKGATIKDVSLGKGTSLYNNVSLGGGDIYVGGLVSYAEATTISGCSFTGEMEVSSYTEEGSALYTGGIVGWADESSSIEYCKMSGKLTISCPDMSDLTCYIGGLAGLVKGSLLASEMSGEVRYSSSVQQVRLGGVESTVISGAKVGNNTFSGSIFLGGSALNAAVGGLYGSVETNSSFDYASDKSISMGSLTVNSYNSSEDTRIFAGGMIGKAIPHINLSMSGYENKTNILLNQTAALASKYICLGGVLGGCDDVDEDGVINLLSLENLTNSGSIMLRYGTGKSAVRHGLFGGIVGMVNGPVTIKSCTNGGAVGAADTSKDDQDVAGNARCGASSNDYCEIIGGIVGYAKGGNLTLESCVNSAPVTNLHYSNRPSTSTYDGMFSSQVAGGILGAFVYVPDPDGSFKLTIASCTNTDKGQVLCFRGYAGGVVGFCRNATITGSSSMGAQAASTNDNAYYRGGIAGGVINTNISDCWAKCSISSGSGGSAEAAFSGGIVGWVKGDDPVTLKNCKYNGVLKCAKSDTKPSYPGGIVSFATEKTTITNCQYGGQIQDIDITSNNVSTLSYVVGNYGDDPGCTINGIDFWEGKI